MKSHNLIVKLILLLVIPSVCWAGGLTDSAIHLRPSAPPKFQSDHKALDATFNTSIYRVTGPTGSNAYDVGENVENKCPVQHFTNPWNKNSDHFIVWWDMSAKVGPYNSRVREYSFDGNSFAITGYTDMRGLTGRSAGTEPSFLNYNRGIEYSKSKDRLVYGIKSSVDAIGTYDFSNNTATTLSPQPNWLALFRGNNIDNLMKSDDDDRFGFWVGYDLIPKAYVVWVRSINAYAYIDLSSANWDSGYFPKPGSCSLSRSGNFVRIIGRKNGESKTVNYIYQITVSGGKVSIGSPDAYYAYGPSNYYFGGKMSTNRDLIVNEDGQGTGGYPYKILHRSLTNMGAFTSIFNSSYSGIFCHPAYGPTGLASGGFIAYKPIVGWQQDTGSIYKHVYGNSYPSDFDYFWYGTVAYTKVTTLTALDGPGKFFYDKINHVVYTWISGGKAPIDYKAFGGDWTPYADELVVMKTDGSTPVRLCHIWSNFVNNDLDEVPSIISPDGRYVLFYSNWNGSGRHDVFIVDTRSINPPPAPSHEPSPSEPIPIAPPPTITPTPTPTPREGKPHVKRDKLVHGAQIYLAASEMTGSGLPIGNIKSYELTNSTNVVKTNDTNVITTNDTNIATGVQVVDSTKSPALDSNNLIKDSSKSSWSSGADGNKVDKGGVGEVLLKRDKARNIFTNLRDPNLMAESNEFATSNQKITPELLGLAPGDTAERDRLIQYIQGYDSYTKNKGNNTTEKREWLLGAILHSRPLVIPYKNSRSVIFVGANDGMFHAFDNTTGEELWGFIPNELLSRLKDLTSGNKLEYFVDGSPKAYITQSQKIVIFGLRRGGSNYYALDVTDPGNPKFLWENGPETTGFSEMGQTWSTPQIGKVKYGSGEKVVCFIGGGYDENQDKKTPATEDKKGRAVYVVDLFTGQQIWRWDYKKDPNMKYSIPSDVASVDINGDGYIDRLYVGDMGGRMWSFDIKNPDPNAWSGRMVFNSNLGYTGSVKQKIFHAPDVTLEKGGEMVLFGTGDREHPNEKNRIEKFYAFMDKGQGAMLSEDNLADVTKDFATVQNLANKEGWFISMEDKGEKVLAPPVVAFGVVYFTTFTPSLDGDGIARIYALNYRVGNPIFNLNPENDKGGPKIDLSDRSKIIGTGIPSGTVISALGGRPIAYTGFAGGLYSTHLKGHSTIIPISWKEVSKKK